MEESGIEIIIGMLARMGIIASHGFEFIGGYHMIVAVALLWTIEEIVAIKVSARCLKHRRKAEVGAVGALERRLLHMAHKESRWLVATKKGKL